MAAVYDIQPQNHRRQIITTISRRSTFYSARTCLPLSIYHTNVPTHRFCTLSSHHSKMTCKNAVSIGHGSSIVLSRSRGSSEDAPCAPLFPCQCHHNDAAARHRIKPRVMRHPHAVLDCTISRSPITLARRALALLQLCLCLAPPAHFNFFWREVLFTLLILPSIGPLSSPSIGKASVD